MTDTSDLQNNSWSLIRKILFRFFFIYFILYHMPLYWLSDVWGFKYLSDLYDQGFTWLVIKANEHFFQVFNVKHVVPVSNGSGDTSFAWASLYFTVVIAAIGAFIWSIADFKRKSYRQMNYLLCLFVRYTLAVIAFGYGIDKIFVAQMPFPLTSQLATPLGDLLPMRLSWLFIGYSAPYQIFSGIMEVLVAFLLLYRRTATLGALIATAVFINVLMLNLCYDIPVKQYAMNLVLLCLYLLVNEYKRMACFFVLNKPAANCSVYDYPLTKKWMRVSKLIIKLVVVYLFFNTYHQTLKLDKDIKAIKIHKDFKPGVYEVTKYVINKDTLPALITDSIRWKDLIIENNMTGSINAGDTAFRRRYGRGYFNFKVDSLQPIIHFKKTAASEKDLFLFHYQLPDSNTIHLWGAKKNDSVFIELKRSARHFQLAERQFHWLSEANR